MNYLFDTNIVSDLGKEKPHPALVRWVQSLDVRRVFISAITVGEMRFGIEKQRRAGHAPALIERQLQKLALLESVYANRVVPFDRMVAHEWGRIFACYPHLPVAIDAQIAAIAIHHGMTLVTRDGDFWELAYRLASHDVALSLINPYTVKGTA